MDAVISFPSLLGGIYRPAADRKPAAPSGSNQMSMSPRQTAALMPTEFAPAGQGAETKQDVAETKQELSRLVEDMRQMASKANAYMKQADTHLEFQVSEVTGRVIISVVNSDTKEIVRQIPPDTMTRFSDRMTQMRGLLFETSG
jgi:flagellar protein FlaG